MKMALNSLSPLVVMMALTDGSLLASCCTTTLTLVNIAKEFT
jgi:hypothetical protein